MTTLETLKAARAKIADRKHWTRTVYARDRHSRPVEPTDAKACRWCAIGAIRSVNEAGEDAAFYLLYRFCDSVWEFNDTHTHAEVLALFDKAIAEAQ